MLGQAASAQQIAFWAALAVGALFRVYRAGARDAEEAPAQAFLIVIFAALCFIVLSLNWR